MTQIYYNRYAYSTKGSPVEFSAPKALGMFEIRYVIGESKRTLASVDIMLKPSVASIEPPSEAAVGIPIEVSWSDPNGKGDSIEIVAESSTEAAKLIGKAGTILGSPLFIYAPESAGNYEIRYKSKDTCKILVRSGLVVK